MSTFRVKNNTKYQPVSIRTVHSTHKQFLSEFQKKRSQLPDKKNKLEASKKRLSELERMDPSTYTVSSIREKSRLKGTITRLEKFVSEVENYDDDIDYLASVGDLVMDYYAIDDGDYIGTKTSDVMELQEKEVEEKSKETTVEDIEKDMSMLDRLNKKSKKNKMKPKTTRKRFNKNQKKFKTNSITSYLCEETDKEMSNNKAIIHNCYLSIVDTSYVPTEKDNNMTNECMQCGKERMIIQTEGLCVCEICGEVEYIVTDVDTTTSKDPMPEKNGYPYKRINHFNELTLLLITTSRQWGYGVTPMGKRCKLHH